MADFITIGVYGWEAESFFNALVMARVDTFCDLRARRGVRGSEYVFANSQRLQARLVELRIRYLHYPELAPSPATRALQHAADEASDTARRKRALLSPAFVQAYRLERLAVFDSGAFLADLGSDTRVAALFCVEREAAACHRSLLAGRLAKEAGVHVTHLVP